MEEARFQLSDDTWAYVDQARSKLVVEIDLPKEDKQPSATEVIELSKSHQMN